MPGFHAGHPPRNKGLRYPTDPPTVEEIVAVMRIARRRTARPAAARAGRVVLWRAGLRIDEALALREPDLERRRGSSLSPRAKEDDVASGWTTGADRNLNRGSLLTVALPIGPVFCVINGRPRGRP
jgi:hypothetical protein